MRFENLQNSRLYKLYRNDQMSRLKRKIQQIKQRKNQHSLNKQKYLLPYISAGYGFSSERRHQIQKQNQRLKQKIKKVKNNHLSQYCNPSILNKVKQQKKLYFQNIINTESKHLQTFKIAKLNKHEIHGLLRTDRLKCTNNEIKKNNQDNCAKSFREQVLYLYQSNLKCKKNLKIL